MSHPYTNMLIHATSPYLLQHAHNPVDWYEWSPGALSRAQKEGKPILVSIGYSSCHWCHVMERESFEKKDIADVMNKFFICIKVDREERPDIDQIYMEAVQALGVNGGWPLNVFLTPEQKPFFGGTYFTPQVWVQVLQNIHNAYTANRDKIENTAEELRMHLLQSDVGRFLKPGNSVGDPEDYDAIYANLEARFDTKHGGMDRAPKFVMPSLWRYLLRYQYTTHSKAALEQVRLTLDKISQGGIYDQIRGGFARYSVDGYWFAPHFEKMLYDNAQLLSLFSEAYAVTKDTSYKSLVYETFEWLLLEMTNKNGGFYSALDADSEGIEGKFYIWTAEEFRKITGEDYSVLSSYYNVKDQGNWEHGSNILHRTGTDESFLQANGLSHGKLAAILREGKQKLLDHRDKRIRPGLDDKIITAWNAMTICGLLDAHAYLQDDRFLETGKRNMEFILENLHDNNTLYRSFKGKRSVTTGFLDDYAYVIQALIKLYQATFEESWLAKAEALTVYAIDNFFDPTEKFFFYTSGTAEKLITRKKEIFDNVIPSSNSLMAGNLYALGTMLDNDDWKDKATAMVTSLLHIIKSEPNYMSHWATVMMEINQGLKEVLLLGEGIGKLREELHKDFHPFNVVLGSTGNSKLALFEDKVRINDTDTIYVCVNKTCKLPVHTVDDAINQF